MVIRPTFRDGGDPGGGGGLAVLKIQRKKPRDRSRRRRPHLEFLVSETSQSPF